MYTIICEFLLLKSFSFHVKVMKIYYVKIVYLHMHALTYTVITCRAFDIDKNIVTQKISNTKILQTKLM